ncbi:MAG TPA: DUF192 domain-containing protein [Devosiaceae bacterium]
MRAVFLAAIVFVFAQVLSACAMSENTVVLHTAKGDFTFNVELAQTPDERAKGLMYRQELAKDAGMLFDFGSEQNVAFWMQNTLIPLDMIFVATDGTVRSIHVNARPMDTTPIPSGVPVRFVLEIAGGRSQEIGLEPGDRMENPRVGTPDNT